MGMDRFARDMISLREFFLIQPPLLGGSGGEYPKFLHFFAL